MRKNIYIPSKQRGAALVIGLLLLVILTLLAISGMNSASTQLIMAGNEQYRQKAFNASSAGVEQGIADLPKAKQDLTNPTTVPKTMVTNADAEDSYETSTQYIGSEDTVSGFSAGRFSALHYQITSTGTAIRNSTSVQDQGAYLVQRSDTGAFGSIN